MLTAFAFTRKSCRPVLHTQVATEVVAPASIALLWCSSLYSRQSLLELQVAATSVDMPTTSGQKQDLRMEGGTHGEAAVDGLLFLPGGRLVSKSADGRAFIWDFAGRCNLASWKVPYSDIPVGRLQSTMTVAVHLLAAQIWQAPGCAGLLTVMLAAGEPWTQGVGTHLLALPGRCLAAGKTWARPGAAEWGPRRSATLSAQATTAAAYMSLMQLLGTALRMSHPSRCKPCVGTAGYCEGAHVRGDAHCLLST